MPNGFFMLQFFNEKGIGVLPPLGMVLGVGSGSSQGEDRAGPALNPLKGSSARLPPSVFLVARIRPNVAH